MALPIDPYYTTGPADWLRRRVVQTLGVDIAVRDDLTVPGFGDRAAGTIYVRPGLDLIPFHWLLSRGVLHQLFGDEAAPDFRTADAVQDARVIPLPRRPW